MPLEQCCEVKKENAYWIYKVVLYKWWSISFTCLGHDWILKIYLNSIFFFYLVRFSWGVVSWGRWFYPNFTSTDETSPGFLCNFRIHGYIAVQLSVINFKIMDASRRLWHFPINRHRFFFSAQRNGYDRFDWWTPHAWKWLFKLLNYLWGRTHIVLCTV